MSHQDSSIVKILVSLISSQRVNLEPYGPLLPVIAVVASLFAASTAFIIGIVIATPKAIVGLFTHETLIHLSFQASFLLLATLVVVRLMFALWSGLAVFLVSLVFKFRVGLKRPRGLRDPAVSRLQIRFTKRVLSSSNFSQSLLTLRAIVVSMLLIWFLAPYPVHGKVHGSPITILAVFIFPLIIIMSFAGTLSANRVSSFPSLVQFFSAPNGARILIAAFLFFFVYVGMMRSVALMHGLTVEGKLVH
jgi:hypothetical protein